MNEYPAGLQCPIPTTGNSEHVVLGHGEGGCLTRRLIREQIFPDLTNEYLAALGDAAIVPSSAGKLAFTTDSFVVSPLFFPGGDIGSLAVFGTVNDLAVTGAEPLWLTLSLILEEGLDFSVLQRVLRSIAESARRAQVTIVAGDTKVVPAGIADRMFITTAGIGRLLDPAPPGAAALQLTDRILVTGPIGQHGVAVLAAREGLEFDPPPASDCRPLTDLVSVLRSAHVPIHAMRDATRGGVTSVLHEWADACGLTLAIDEETIPVSPEVRGACELLGLDPLHIANEGTMLVAVPAASADAALSALRSHPDGSHTQMIGEAQNRGICPVTIRRSLGREVPLDEPIGAPLPRIC